jgi:hypothetical protein
MGGMTMVPTYSANSQVWLSDDGMEWREVETEQDWFPRNGLEAADVEGELVVLGGSLYNDVHVMMPGPAPSPSTNLGMGIIVGVSVAGAVVLAAAGYRGYQTIPGYYDQYKKDKAAEEAGVARGLREHLHGHEQEQVANEYDSLEAEFDSQRNPPSDVEGASDGSSGSAWGSNDFVMGWKSSSEKLLTPGMEPVVEQDIEESLSANPKSPFLQPQ